MRITKGYYYIHLWIGDRVIYIRRRKFDGKWDADLINGKTPRFGMMKV